MPRADSVVAVLADSDVSWQRITLPKAPAAKLRAALGGLLEDHLLEDDEALHLALAPGAQAGAAGVGGGDAQGLAARRTGHAGKGAG